MNISCDTPFGILKYAACNGNGACSVDGVSCVCHPGYSSLTDWYNLPHNNCITNARGNGIAAIVLTTLSVVSFVLIVFKFALLYGERKRYGRTFNEPSRVTLAMTAPVVIIIVYEILCILNNAAVLIDSVGLSVCLICLHLSWELNIFLVSRWLIRAVAAGDDENENNSSSQRRLEAAIIFAAASGVLVFAIFAIVLVVLFTTKSSAVYRFYAIFSAFCVGIHALPYMFAQYSDRFTNSMSTTESDERSGAIIANGPDTVAKPSTKSFFSIRDLIVMALAVIYHVIFAIFAEFSPYYVQAQLASGIVFSLVCYRLFPGQFSEDDNNTPSAMSDNDQGHSSALSDTIGTVTAMESSEQ